MFFDCVRDNNTGKVWFNGTPQETKAFLRHFEPDLYAKMHVIDGETLSRWTVENYMARESQDLQGL
jgi:hypothetical protein